MAYRPALSDPLRSRLSDWPGSPTYAMGESCAGHIELKLHTLHSPFFEHQWNITSSPVVRRVGDPHPPLSQTLGGMPSCFLKKVLYAVLELNPLS